MKKISFTKMSGAGNDFIVFDGNQLPEIDLKPEGVSKLCARGTGIGADGILVVGNDSGYDFNMSYFNADGSTGTLCGNGARCAIKYAYLSGRIRGRHTSFSSNGTAYTGEVLESDKIKFNLGLPKDFKFNMKLMAAGQQINAAFVNTGSPHVVIKSGELVRNILDTISASDALEKLPVYELGREIRYLNDFAPGGTNVNFINIHDNAIYIRTYERGVENETLACGTGSVASALISYFSDGVRPPVSIITRNGTQLIVDFNIEGPDINNVSLTGPAEVTFTGEFNSDMYF